ncbi:MAG: DUF2147 domain-containing protein [Erythrobacter sp.]|nr:DUF2147 domain-containing protein [Erythrobacter sp.]
MRSLFLGGAIGVLAVSPAAAAEPITGRWITAEKDAVVTIEQCGKTLCGKIARFLEPPPQGPDQRDINNPDPKLKQRKLLGMPVLTGFTRDDDLWRGQIYDPKTGKTYRSVVRRTGPGTLEVQGCITIFCQSQTWRRAS